jgi:hypothetical protein
MTKKVLALLVLFICMHINASKPKSVLKRSASVPKSLNLQSLAEQKKANELRKNFIVYFNLYEKYEDIPESRWTWADPNATVASLNSFIIKYFRLKKKQRFCVTRENHPLSVNPNIKIKDLPPAEDAMFNQRNLEIHLISKQ